MSGGRGGAAGWRRTLASLCWSSREARRCGTCAHFDNDPQRLERRFGNLAAMSSGFASVKAGDGLCRRAGLYLPAGETCPDHATESGFQPSSASHRTFW